jgi:hypothetical protein
MTTNKNLWFITIATLLAAAVVFGGCGSETNKRKAVPIMGKRTEEPTPTPALIGNKSAPGKRTEKAPQLSPTPY